MLLDLLYCRRGDLLYNSGRTVALRAIVELLTLLVIALLIIKSETPLRSRLVGSPAIAAPYGSKMR